MTNETRDPSFSPPVPMEIPGPPVLLRQLLVCVCVCVLFFFFFSFFLFFSQTVFADPPRKQQTGESEVTRNASFHPHVPQNYYNNRSFNRPLAPPCWIGFKNFLPNAGRSGVDGLFVSVNMDLNGGVLLLTTVRVWNALTTRQAGCKVSQEEDLFPFLILW